MRRHTSIDTYHLTHYRRTVTKTHKVQVTLDNGRRRLDAIDTLYSLDPVPAAVDQEQWEREYSSLKTGLSTGCAPAATVGPGRPWPGPAGR